MSMEWPRFKRFVIYLAQEVTQHKTSYFDMGEPHIYFYFFFVTPEILYQSSECNNFIR